MQEADFQERVIKQNKPWKENNHTVSVYSSQPYINTHQSINALRNDIWRDNMPKKGGHRYVRDYTKKNADGEKLQVIEIYESKPKRFDYLVWVKK